MNRIIGGECTRPRVLLVAPRRNLAPSAFTILPFPLTPKPSAMRQLLDCASPLALSDEASTGLEQETSTPENPEGAAEISGRRLESVPHLGTDLFRFPIEAIVDFLKAANQSGATGWEADWHAEGHTRFRQCRS